jgi:hypothetical protein
MSRSAKSRLHLRLVVLLVCAAVAEAAPRYALAQPLEPNATAPGHDKVPPLTLRSYIALPGVYGRIDHYGWDARRGVLLVTALGNNTVEIVDQWKRVHTI